MSYGDSTCDECGEQLDHSAWIFLAQKRPFCLACADLDHLLFLPSGNAAVTRRAKNNSQLYAVVLKWRRARRRYERQGLLVEEEALIKAEEACLADEETRRRRRERAALRRQELDDEYVRQFADRVRASFPGCPPAREQIIAQHACRKYSGRVGRSAAARQFDEAAIRAAVVAHIRHAMTNYDQLLGRGRNRSDARTEVRSQVDRVLDTWKADTH